MSADRILFVDDEEHVRISAGQTLELAGFKVTCVADARAALELIQSDDFDAVISDIRMPGMDGLALMRHVLDRDPEMPFILITGHGDVSTAVEAMHGGAFHFIEKPFATGLLAETVARATEKRRMARRVATLQQALNAKADRGVNILGTSPAMETLRDRLITLAESPADVLIRGETGTGKELAARAIHEWGARHAANFVAVNCGALPSELVESELFGHEAGAFTGAKSRRIGKFEHADGGTLFLDEIESMPLDLQVRLLRVLQDRQIERLGSNDPIVLDLRIVAASKIDLAKASRDGVFREDLYYRLNVASIDLPPLRQHRDDIGLLFTHFVTDACSRSDREVPDGMETVLGELKVYDWPGNVRELRNAAERWVLFGETELTSDGGDGDPATTALPDHIRAFEKTLIAEALTRARGDIKQVIEVLGIPRKTLYDKMTRHGLKPEDYR
jgi:two-component system, NtrC family, C4-dicarboxylate transport response regulator DctD